MLCYRDKTFCASPNCVNACGRKMTEQERAEAEKLGWPVAYANFCVEELKTNEVENVVI